MRNLRARLRGQRLFQPVAPAALEKDRALEAGQKRADRGRLGDGLDLSGGVAVLHQPLAQCRRLVANDEQAVPRTQPQPAAQLR